MSSDQTCALIYSGNATLRKPVGKSCSLGNIPDYYIDVKDEGDVQAGLKFAKEKKIPVVVKNSGHDHKGRSSGAGTLALWMNSYRPAMKLQKDFIPNGCAQPVGNGISLGAGTDFKALYTFADENEATVVGGASATVRPAGGFTLGGGHGPLSTTLGLSVDNVLEMQAVLPNGTYITANRCQNQDMFYALRGGGGNAFGILMKLTLKAHPQKRTQYFSFSGTAVNRTAFRELIHVVTVNSNAWAAAGWGGTIGTALGAPMSLSLRIHNIELDHASGRKSMQALLDLQGSPLLKSNTTRISHNETSSFYKGYKAVYGAGDGVMGVGTTMSSRLIPGSAIETPEQQQKMTDALAKASEMLAPDHGPYNASTDPNDATSVTPAWRKAIWHVVIKQGIPNDANKTAIMDAYRNTYAVADLFRKLVPDTGAYQNEADLFEPNHEDTFWGERNYARLLKIKKEIDPDNLLTCWQCIGFDRSDPRYSCYPDFRP
ncbi:FAD-binding domain-containing protein [Tothia fuscella]|uniref:FAD-binding domain-containing protein n=1 Tax=Tothia fuscella TaxID=1048955 RepID=A0A9P4NYX0_9PEZI|nr:FAD-binding domain-containing protein [Tothia fuscella]